MEFSSITREPFKMLRRVLSIVVLAALPCSKLVKATNVEARVMFGAWVRFPEDTYHRNRDVRLPTLHDTAQVDHVFLSRIGISRNWVTPVLSW